MSNEIRLAFAHPSERAEATASKDPLDRISLRDHIVEVDIGAFQAERGHSQRICFNVVVEVRPLTDPVEDDVDRILSYDRVTEAIAHELAAERLNLLETLAARVAERILIEPQAMRVFVRIEKLDRGPGALGVEIARSKSVVPTLVASTEEADAPHPRVVFLSNEALNSSLLKAWIDQLQALSVPLVFCVGAPEAETPVTGHAMTQRRIDLLAIEQNAWALASKDERCVVVSTRTEMDWAMRNGQTCVWAPSKMVLDAVDGPSSSAKDTLALGAWFAEHMQAQDFWIIGAELPLELSIPATCVAVGQAKL